MKKPNNASNLAPLSTFKKICCLQGLLKQLTSSKERFIKNKKKLLLKMKNNCYNYYKTKIGMQQIYDYCESNNPTGYLEYTLIEEAKCIFPKNYQEIYDLFFLLRNENLKMLKLINNLPEKNFDIFSNFLVHFCYENTICSSFNNEELVFIIYLLLEELILKKFPAKFETAKDDIEKSYINPKTFLFSVFKSMTRKVDVRNFLHSILEENISKIENFRRKLQICQKNDINSEIEKMQNLRTSDFKKCISGDAYKTLQIQDRVEIDMVRESMKIKPMKMNLFEIDDFLNNDESDIDILKKDAINDYAALEKFLIEKNVDKEYLNQKLNEYKKLSNDSNINKNKNKNSNQKIINTTMIEYINQLIKDLNTVNNFKDNLKKIFEKATDYYEIYEIKKSSYEQITSFIEELINNLEENITSIPFTIKCITNVIEILMNKKYNKSIPNIYLLTFKLNFFIGNIILPVLSNPDYNGIMTKGVISKTTKENLRLISLIIQKIISGHLFNNSEEEIEYTIFNKFIVDQMPKLINIIINSQKNFNVPSFIKKLVSNSDENEEKRDINYKYFYENIHENIHYQSICFNFKHLYVIIDAINKGKETFILKNKNENEKQLFKKICEYADDVSKWVINGENTHRCEFLYLTKIAYQEEFNKKMNFMIGDNFKGILSKQKNILLIEIKAALLAVLDYVNILHKENLNVFVLREDEIIYNKEIISVLTTHQKTQIYENLGLNGGVKKSEENSKNKLINDDKLKGLEGDENEDADFLKIIFPQIVNEIKFEIGLSIDQDKNKKVVNQVSYLQMHLVELAEDYKKNNFSKLFLELINMTKLVMTLLKNNNILNQYHIKNLEGDKLYMIINNNYQQMKNVEKNICLEYLFFNISVLGKFTITDENGIINKIVYETAQNEYNVDTIASFLKIIPNFRKYESKSENILTLEEKVEISDALVNYYKDMRVVIKKQGIISRFSNDELGSIFIELENYILFKLYDKLYPSKPTKEDITFYTKCCCLDFIKPEHLIKNKKIVNEKLWKTAMELINQMDDKFTPADKIKCFGKAFAILQNSITFCSGKDELGIDDTIPPLIYIVMKSKPKKLISDFNYCSLFLNQDLAKKEYGILLSQIGLVMNVIKDMSHKDFINITKEDFDSKYAEYQKKFESCK